MIVRSKQIYLEDSCFDGFLIVENGLIKAVEPATADLAADINASEFRVIPGIFDTHNHGTYGYNLLDRVDDMPKEIRGYLKGLAAQGVTSILPTPEYDLIADIAEMAQKENDGAKIVGIHSEGPYLNRVGEKGVDTGHPDVDMAVVRKMVADGQGLLKLVALAPEIENIDEAIDYLNAQKIRLAFAHSNNNYQEAQSAFDKGLSVSTHTANVMSGIHHRNMGGLGACLLNEKVWCEVICDGLHVNDEMLRLMFKVKPYDKFMMVSDSVSIAGAPVGRYNMLGFLPVNITEAGFCLSDTGRLCGSTKSVLYDIGHLVNYVDVPINEALKMAALNPAICYGLDQRKGSLKVGKDADFVIIDADYQALATFSEGRKVFDRLVDTELFNPAFFELCSLD